MPVRLIPIVLSIVAVSAASAAPAIEQSDASLNIRLDGDVRLAFLLHDGWLLGLRQASVAGIETTSPETVLRPLIAQEWGEGRTIWPLMKLLKAEADGDAVKVTAQLYGSSCRRCRNRAARTSSAACHRRCRSLSCSGS